VNPLATYSFLPWLRQGVANSITAPDNTLAGQSRASIQVALQLAGDPVTAGPELTQAIAQNIELYGPGDIVGIESRAVIRTDPHPWITNFESNYLPAVDFYDEDLPWRYTPAAPDASGLRLRPWITLIVLTEDEFKDATNIANRPLPFISVAGMNVFPPADQLWAWAHVHFNQSLSADASELVSPDMTAVLPRVQSALAANPDLGYSRLMCPRRLNNNTGYHAFIVPTFETGRLAGLGQDPALAPSATASAWAPYGGQLEAQNFPFYFRWYFRTGSRGDFLYLVNLLRAQAVDTRVGIRDMDVRKPGLNIPGIANPALNGILRLGGALQVPTADLNTDELALRQTFEDWDKPYPDDFQKSLAAFVNLSDDYVTQTAKAANAASGLGPDVENDNDPLITPPLYGRWHSLTQRLLTKADGTPADNDTNWVHRLNLDPRFRVPAAFGTDVVETNAEEYMNYAWEQIGDVLAANRRIRGLQLATDVSSRMYARHVTTLAASNAERALSVTSPVARRILVAGTSVAFMQKTSLVPPVLTSTVLRRVLRPGARLTRSLSFDGTATRQNLLTRINAGEVTSAAPKVVPPGVATVDQAAGAAAPSGAPALLLQWLARYPWLPIAVFLVAILLAVVLFFVLGPAVGTIFAVALIGFGVYAYRLLNRWKTAEDAQASITEAEQTPQAVSQLPQSSNFVLSQPGSTFRPTEGGSDSVTAVKFKAALKDSFSLLVTSKAVAERPAPQPLDLTTVTKAMVEGIDPRTTILRRGLSLISLPPWVLQFIGDNFGEVMAYPKIDLPMYKELKAISIELFLPNINLIAKDSITLVETNQRFIESYMVGLNHEFARKLLWREYPTDQRGSYFRQFWSVGSTIDSEGLSDDALKEKLYDIPELHRWPITSNLGEHNARSTGKPGEEDAVLVIRGELLKKYPTTVVYANRAAWSTNAQGNVDKTLPRTLVPIPAGQEDKPPRDVIRGPLYDAKADPDIYFFGFDLTIDEAKGTADDPGWFFVLKERPGEPRFGLELSQTGAAEVFDELAWDAGIAPGQFLSANSFGNVPLTSPPIDSEDHDKLLQFGDDEKVNAAAVSSARWAYLLFRQPIMVAVHADQMLRKDRP
jgi:hypothetical protein